MSSISQRYKLSQLLSPLVVTKASGVLPLVIRRLLLYAAFCITTGLLVIGLLTSIWLWQVKDWGISVDWDGRLLAVQTGSRADQAGVVPGDYISFLDFQQLKYLAGRSRVGELVEVPISHEGKQRTVTLEAEESSTSRRIDLSIPTWVGMGFVLLGIAPLIARRRDFTLWLFFLSSEVVGLFLMTQKPRTFHLFWAEAVTYVTMALFPALLFHFHTRFPQIKFGRWRRPLVTLVYAWGAVVLPFNLPGLWDWSYHTSDSEVWIIELYLSGMLLACLGMLIHTYRRTADKRVRQQLKAITVCSGVGLAVNPVLMVPALLLSLDMSNVLENLSVIAALLAPFGYAYAILRYDLLTDGVLWRRWLIRTAITSGLFLIGGVIGVLVLRNDSIPAGTLIEIGALAVLGAVAIGILNTALGEWVEERTLKGNSYVDLLDYATQELQHFHKLEDYTHFFTESLTRRLEISGAMIFLAGDDRQEVLLRGYSRTLQAGMSRPAPRLASDGDLHTLLATARGPIVLGTLLLPTAPPFNDEETALLEMLREAQMELLLPLVTSQAGQLLGFVALGVKETDEPYPGQELTMLAALSRTAATSAENVLLFDAQERQLALLKEERDYRAGLAQRITTAADQERKRIARDLHDRPLQDLGLLSRALTRMRGDVQELQVQCEELHEQIESDAVGSDQDSRTLLLATLVDWEARLSRILGEETDFADMVDANENPLLIEHHPTIEGLVSQVVTTASLLREICNNLHPTYLDSPLATTVRNTVASLRQHYSGVEIQVDVAGPEPANLPDEVKVVCKHILDQALQNALQHGDATDIEVALSFDDEQRFTLIVRDNGRGFVPRPMRMLRGAGHHGLANMQERADSVAGRLHIESVPGNGTEVLLYVPTNGETAHKAS